jgi:hypothetical protein
VSSGRKNGMMAICLQSVAYGYKRQKNGAICSVISRSRVKLGQSQTHLCDEESGKCQ